MIGKSSINSNVENDDKQQCHFPTFLDIGQKINFKLTTKKTKTEKGFFLASNEISYPILLLIHAEMMISERKKNENPVFVKISLSNYQLNDYVVVVVDGKRLRLCVCVCESQWQ